MSTVPLEERIALAIFDEVSRLKFLKMPVKLSDLERVIKPYVHDLKAKKVAKGEDPRIEEIYMLYPRKEGGSAARASIAQAIAQNGYERVFEGTRTYGAAVATWPKGYRFRRDEVGGVERDLVPMATTWFNQHRYTDDPNEWKKFSASFGRTVEEPVAPKDWQERIRAEFPESSYATETRKFAELPAHAQRTILEVLAKIEQGRAVA